MILIMAITTLTDPVDIAQNTNAPVIDGIISAGEWGNATQFEGDYYTFSPTVGDKMLFGMDVYMQYDNDFMYVMFNVEQDTSTLISKTAQRDQGFNQDRLGIQIDPTGNRQELYWIVVALSGTVNDSREMRSGAIGEDYTWDIDVRNAVRITDYGYVVEMAIPFSGFRMPQGEENVWNINFYRNVNYLQKLGTYAPYPSSMYDSRFQAMFPVRIKGIARHREKMDIIPYGIYGARFLGARETMGDAGLDVRLPVSQTSVANLAFNPDYSQLEGDPFQFEFNNQYALYLSEYRPFFLEERSIFATDGAVYYTRAMVNPYIAGRYSYKDENSKAGLIIAKDETDSNIGNTNAYAGIARYTHVFTNASSGLMLLARNEEWNRNSIVLMNDAMFNITPNLNIAYTAAGSYIQEKDSTGTYTESSRGFYSDAYLRYRNAGLTFVGHLNVLSPDYENDLGYVTERNQLYFGGYLGYTFYYQSNIIQRFSIGEDFGFEEPWDLFTDGMGEVAGDSSKYAYSDSLEYFVHTQISASLFNGTYVLFEIKPSRLRWSGFTYEAPSLRLYIESNINRYFSYNFTAVEGYGFDYRNLRVTQRNTAVGNIYIRPTTFLTLNTGLYVDRQYADTTINASTWRDAGTDMTWVWNAWSYDAGIAFNPINSLALKCIFEHGDALFNAGYYEENDQTRLVDTRVFGIIEYRPAPGNVIYLGARYVFRNGNAIRTESEENLLFFKFTSRFQI